MSTETSHHLRRAGRGRVFLLTAFVAALAFAAGALVPRLINAAHQAHDHSHTSGAAGQLWTCSMHPQVIRDAPGVCPICHMALTPVAGSGAAARGTMGAAELTIDPAVVQNMGVRVAEVKRGPLTMTVRAVGMIEEAQPNQHDVNLRISGWIERLYANTDGMHVMQGEPLFDLYSPQLQVAVQELIAARVARDNAAQTDALSKRAADAMFASVEQKLELWGLTPQQVEALAKAERAPRTVSILSPATGHVTEKAIVEGAAIKEGDRVLRIVDHRTVWLNLQVYEKDLPFTHIGDHIVAAVNGIPGRTFEGELTFIHPHLDMMTRTAMVRVVLPNESLDLRPGMYATATIASQRAPDAVLVPREAVIETGTRQVAFVALDGGHFEPREVKLGPAGEGDVVQVLSGLAPGERVVTSGQFLLDAESRLQETIRRHTRGNLLSETQPATHPAADTLPVTAPSMEGHR